MPRSAPRLSLPSFFAAKPTAIALVILSALGFSFLAVFGKMAMARGIATSDLLVWRFAGSAVILAVVAAVAPAHRLGARQSLAPFLMGFLGYASMSFLFLRTVSLVGSGKATLLLYTYPAFITVLEWLTGRSRPQGRHALVLVLCLAGCALTLAGEGASFNEEGVMLGLLTACVYSLYLWVGSVSLGASSPFGATLFVSLGALASLGAAALAYGGLALPAVPGEWLLMAGVALVATVLPIAFTFQAMKSITAADVAVFATVEPVCALGLAYLFFGETLSPRQAAGAGLLLLGIVLKRPGN